MNAATLIFSVLGLACLGVVGLGVKEVYLNVEKVSATPAAFRVLSTIFAVFVMVLGATFAGLALSFALTKEWSALPHFMLLACLCGISIYLQLKPARKLVASAAQAAPAQARVEPTADPVTAATPAVAPASAEQSASVAPVVAASAVAATAVAATAAAASDVDEASLPDAPAPAVVSGISDDALDAWTPEEEDVAAPVAQAPLAETAVASEVVEAAPVAVMAEQSVTEMSAPADIEELTAAVPPAVPAAAAPSFDDEAADVLDLSGVTKTSDAPVTVNAEQRVDAVEPASDNEVTRPVVAAPSDISVAVA